MVRQPHAINSIGSGGGIKWRPANSADLNGIQQIANAIHSELPESPEFFAEKLSLFPEGCFVLAMNEALLGYGLSHPWLLNSIPKLNGFLLRLPSPADCILIHDVAVLQQARGQRASSILIRLIEGLAKKRDISYLALISVYNSHPHWARFGFETASNNTADMLKSYGPTARYMVRRLC